MKMELANKVLSLMLSLYGREVLTDDDGNAEPETRAVIEVLEEMVPSDWRLQRLMELVGMKETEDREE